MKKIVFLSLLSALALFTHSVQAAECEPNGLDGFSCVNDDGSTSDSMPNEVGGTDTMSSNGWVTSTDLEDSNDNAELEGSSFNRSDSQSLDSSGRSQKPDAALMGRDWNNPSNTNDGSATSSMSILDQP